MRRLFLILSFLLLLLLPEVSFAATRYARASGDWNSTSTWSATPNGAPGASVPGIGDDVVLVFVGGPGPVTVTVTANASCDSIEIQNPANTGDNLLFINNGVTLTVIGNVDVHGSHTPSGAGRDAKLIINGGTLTVGGDLTVGCHNNQEATLDLSNGTNASSVVNVAGNFSNTASDKGKFLPGTNSTINFNGTSPQVINTSLVIKSYANITINNPAGVTLITDMTAVQLTGSLRVQSGILYNGGYAITPSGNTFEVANGAQFVLTGTSAFPSGFGTVTLQPTSTVNYAGTTQTVAAQNHGNLNVSAGASARTVTLASTGTIGVFTTFSPSSTNNTYVTTGSTLAFNGNAAQTLPSNFATYNNLTVNNTSGSGITLGTSTTVNGTLTFTTGTVTTGSNTLYLGSAGTVSRTSGHVVGNFKKFIATGATSKTFEVGDASNYTPALVSFASVTTAGDLTASVVSGDHASVGSSTINAAKSVNRNWTLTNNGIVFTTYDATFNFVAGDVDAGASTSAFIVGKYNGSSWTYPAVGTKTSTSAQVTGVTGFSDFEIGEPLPTYTISGHIQNASAVAISGITVTLSDGQAGTTSTDASGNYSFANLTSGLNYTLTPSLTNYTFSAASLTYNSLSANQTTADFTGTSTVTYTISGHIQNGNGASISGVTLTLSGAQAGTTTTDATGNYSFAALPSTNNYIITPSLTNYTFSGASRTYNGLAANQTGADFSAIAISGQAPSLGAAATFAVLAATTITNTGLTVISGNVGVSPGTAVTGFGPGVIQNGAIYSGSGSLAGPAEASALTAYQNLIAQPCVPANNLSGKILGVDTGAVTLVPGVYCFNTSAQLTTTLTLDDGGDPNAVFIFQIGTTITTASYAQVVMSSGGRGANVYWAIGTSATLGTFTAFRGNVIADTSITVTTGVNTNGRLFALGGAVTMDTNNVNAVPASAPPNVTLTLSVSPTGTVQPDTDLVYTINFSNDGSGPASAFVITDPIPDNTDFKLGSATTSLGTTGLTATLAYSDDDGLTWTYTPVSGIGGAPAGYDRTVTDVRWSLAVSLSQTSPNNAGSVAFTARIR